MSRVFAGGVSQEGLELISTYLNKYMPDAEVEQLPVVGIKGKIKNQGKRPDVALIILDSSLYQQCVGIADDVLSLPKVHRYEDDESLKQFLIEKFGVAEEVSGKDKEGISEEPAVPDEVSSEELRKLKVLLQSKEATITNLRNRIRELSLDNEDLNTYIDKIAFLEQQLAEAGSSSGEKGGSKKGSLSVELSNLEVKNRNLQTELETVKSDYAKLKAEYSASKSGSDDREKTEIEMNALKTKITSLEEDLKESESVKAGLEEQLRQLELAKQELAKRCSALENSEGMNSELQSKLDSLKASLESAEDENSALKTELSSLKAELKEVKDALISSENVVKTLTEEVSKASASSAESAELSVELSKAKDSVASLTSSLEIAREDLKKREAEIRELCAKIDAYEEEIEGKDSNISDLSREISSARAEIEDLSEKVKALDELTEKYNSTKEALKSAETSSENLKTEYSFAILDNKKLKERVAELESSAVDTTEVARLRHKCEEQEGDLEEMRDFLNDIKTSPFFLMNNYALPKVAMQLALDVELSFKKSKFVLLSTGSGESGAPMYDIIKERCSKSKKTYLIVDLVTESFIDSSVGLTASLPAHRWLSGEDVTTCISDTKLSNVTAVTTGIGYINDLFFLTVDWTSRLQLLDGLADIILFNIGCLDSAVRLALFNSFIDVCDASNVFVKATPTNLRTTLNHLSSLVNLGISTVVCTDFVSTGKDASQMIFGKLSNKCETLVYSDDTDLGW